MASPPNELNTSSQDAEGAHQLQNATEEAPLPHQSPGDFSGFVEEEGFCSTHNKKRRKCMLRQNPDGTWSCIPGRDECKMKSATGERPFPPPRASTHHQHHHQYSHGGTSAVGGGGDRNAQVVVCANHGKKRSVRNMLQVGNGVYVCHPNEQCQLKVADVDGVVYTHQQQPVVPAGPPTFIADPNGMPQQVYFMAPGPMQGMPMLVHTPSLGSLSISTNTSPSGSGTAQGIGLLAGGQPQMLHTMGGSGSGTHAAPGLLATGGYPIAMQAFPHQQGAPVFVLQPAFAPHPQQHLSHPQHQQQPQQQQ